MTYLAFVDGVWSITGASKRLIYAQILDANSIVQVSLRHEFESVALGVPFTFIQYISSMPVGISIT